MFYRLDKFDGPLFRGGAGGAGAYTGGAYIRDVNWVTYLGGVWGFYTGGVLTGFYGISFNRMI